MLRLGWVALASGFAVLGCGPSVAVDDEGDSASASGTSEDTGSSGGTVPTASGPTTVASTTGVVTSATTGEETSEGSSSTGGPDDAPPVCLVDVYFDIYVNPPHHADVDGDGAPELWTVIPAEPAVLRAYQPTLEGADMVQETTRDGTTFSFADIDGDGRDDLVAAGEFTLDWYAGQPDGSLADEATALSAAGPFAATVADADGDGDDDLFRVQSGELEVLQNDGGAFSLVSAYVLPGHVDEAAQPVRIFVREGGIGVVMQLTWPGDGSDESIVLDVRLQPGGLAIDEVFATGPGLYYHLLGEADVDDDAELEILARKYAAPSYSIVSLEPLGDDFDENVFRTGIGAAVIGDFEGTGTRQLLYQSEANDWANRLYRFDEDSESEVLSDEMNYPNFRRNFDYDLDNADEAYVEYCEFGCYAGMAKLVPC